MHPTITPAEVQERYRTTDFGGFLDAYKWVSRLLQTPQQYALATRHLLQRLQTENVSYVELTLSVGVILWKKQNVADIFEAINKETQQSPIPCFWIFDFIRHFELDHAMEVAEWAIAYRNAGVIGFGCGGDESRGPATKYLPAFQKAQSAGLHLTPHAGETSNADEDRRKRQGCGNKTSENIRDAGSNYAGRERHRRKNRHRILQRVGFR